MKHRHENALRRRIMYGVWDPQDLTQGLDLLGRVAPVTMTSEDVARRWPRVVAAIVVHSDGNFDTNRAALALRAYKCDEMYSCEWYCALAGWERDGFPTEQGSWEAQLRTVNRRFVRSAILAARDTRPHTRR